MTETLKSESSTLRQIILRSVRGDFATQLDFEKFPFEKHELEIVIEPKLPHDTSKFVFGDNLENAIDSDI